MLLEKVAIDLKNTTKSCTNVFLDLTKIENFGSFENLKMQWESVARLVFNNLSKENEYTLVMCVEDFKGNCTVKGYCKKGSLAKLYAFVLNTLSESSSAYVLSFYYGNKNLRWIVKVQ